MTTLYSKRIIDDRNSNEKIFYKIISSSLVYKYRRFWEIVAFPNKIMKLSGESSLMATIKLQNKEQAGCLNLTSGVLLKDILQSQRETG